ncbi:hypothetical protein N2152v2_007894 [Parachlorella kessleri]
MFHHLTVDGDLKHIYAADTPRHAIHRKSVETGIWEVFVGQVDKKGYQDGVGTAALLNAPTGLCINPLGSIIVADSGNACIRQISPSGNVSTLAGKCGTPGARDGPGGEALFSSSMKSVVCLVNCSLLVADVSTGRLRLVIVHDAQCEAAARQHSRPQWSTQQTGLLAVGCASLTFILGAAGTAALQRLHTTAEARVLGYRQLREAVDAAPPPEMRRRLYQLKGLGWNLQHQAAERAAAWGYQGWTRGSLGSMETEEKFMARGSAPTESGPADLGRPDAAPATGDLLGLGGSDSSLLTQQSQARGDCGNLQLASEKADPQQMQLGAIMAQDEVELEDEDDDEVEELQQAFLLVRRHVKDERPLEGKEATVVIELYNAGSSAANNVRVNDTLWPEEAYTTSGSVSAVFDSIPSGATVQYTYTVTPKEAGPYNAQPVTVRYNPIPGDGKEQVSQSGWLQFYSFTFFEAVKYRLVDAGSKATLGYLNTPQDWVRFLSVTGAASLAWFGYKTYSSVKETNQKRRRQKALEELQKMQ